MNKNVRPERLSILLLLYALLLFAAALIFPLLYTGLLGLFFVIVTCTKWGLRGGFIASCWAGTAVFLSYALHGGGLQSVGVSMGVYFLSGLFVGWGVDKNRRQQAILKESEERYRVLVENANESIVVAQDGYHKFVNPMAQDFFGRSREELLNTPFIEFIHPADRSEVSRRHQMRIEGDVSQDRYSFRVMAGDGILKWGKLSGVSIDWEGRPASLNFISDITESKQAEAALRHQLAFEKVISEITSIFLSLPADQSSEAIRAALQLSAEFLEMDRGYIYQYSADGRTMSCTCRWSAAGPDGQPCEPRDYPAEQLPWWFRQGLKGDYLNLNLQNDLPEEAVLEREEYERQGIRIRVAVPMFKGDRAYGLLGFDSFRDEQTWSPQHASFLKVLAGILVNALEKNIAEQKIHDYNMDLELKGLELEGLYRQLDEELDKARRVHEQTLPTKIPRVEGLALATHYQPAQKLGGDFYDLIQLEDRLVLYFSDVSGHGLDGAMLSVFVKDTISSYISLLPAERIAPENVLRFLAEQFSERDYPGDYFISIFLAVLDLETMELNYSGAGFQDTPLVCQGSGERMSLISGGLPISTAVPHELLDLSASTLKLTPGTTVLFHTDGLSEQSAGTQIYVDRLAEVFYANSHLPPSSIVQVINEDFRRFNGGSLQGDDDISMGVLRVGQSLEAGEEAVEQTIPGKSR